MKRRTILILLALACLALVAPAVIAWLLSGSRIDREHFDAIQVGMSRVEVERLLGGTARNEILGHAIVWVPRDGKQVSAQILPGSPLPAIFRDQPHDEQELVWLGEKGLIAVRLGEDGQVAEKYFSTVHETDEPTLGRLFRPFTR